MKIEIANGEIVDRVTILEIKRMKVKDTAKLANIETEYQILLPAMHEIGITNSSPVYQELLKTNSALWDIEDNLRIKEAAKAFDDEFIQLARSVYYQNDTRAALKKQINLETGSRIVEEKDYVKYQ
jgi:nitrous oxide reductase